MHNQLLPWRLAGQKKSYVVRHGMDHSTFGPFFIGTTVPLVLIYVR